MILIARRRARQTRPMRRMRAAWRRWTWLAVAAAASALACGGGDPPPMFAVAKWYDDHAAAISITYDGPASDGSLAYPDARLPARAPLLTDTRPLEDVALGLGLTLDYEVVTVKFDWFPHIETYFLERVVPRGLGYFGHGHLHVDHDRMSYDGAYRSFRRNFERMLDSGLKPVAYAYPRGAGREEETQRALADAGFLSGHFADSRGIGHYIVPGARMTPDNWFALPRLHMESYDFQQCRSCINGTDELIPILDEALKRTAWIAPAYHNVGVYDRYGFYDRDAFEDDMRAIAARDFWVASMNAVVLYVRERERAVVTVEPVGADAAAPDRLRVTLSDGLDNERFDQPLTLRFRPPPSWMGRTVAVLRDGHAVAEIALDASPVLVSLPPDERPWVFQPLAE